MKRLTTIVAAALLWTMLPAEMPAQIVSDQDGLAKAHNDFAIDLYRSLNKSGEENLFFSPYGAYRVLALLYSGAGGDTEEQMADALNVGENPSGFHAALIENGSLLNAIGERGDVELSVADSLWMQSGQALDPDFLKLAGRYGSGVNMVDYRSRGGADQARKDINAWGSENTNGKIPEIINWDLPPDTYLLLANAVFFKGNWARQFDPSETREEPFSRIGEPTVPVQMMHQAGTFRYGYADDAELLELPYVGEDLSMLIALPWDPDGLPRLERALTGEMIASWNEEIWMETLYVSLPRFRIKSDFDMTEEENLRDLGIIDAVDPAKADFVDMNAAPNFFIRVFVQSTYVEVTEEGTEAAAVTVGGGCFPAGTAVRTPSGTMPIEEVVSGTSIWTMDAAGLWTEAQVTANRAYRFAGEMFTVTTAEGAFQATWNHPVLVAGGTNLGSRPVPMDLPESENVSSNAGRWVEVDDLLVGDRLVSADGPVSVTELSSRRTGTTVYDLEVSATHTYAAGSAGVVAHNGTADGAKESAGPPEFIADHPFLFFIRENSTGTILFMGRVGNPAQ